MDIPKEHLYNASVLPVLPFSKALRRLPAAWLFLSRVGVWRTARTSHGEFVFCMSLCALNSLKVTTAKVITYSGRWQNLCAIAHFWDIGCDCHLFASVSKICLNTNSCALRIWLRN